MTTYNPPKKNTAYRFFVELTSQANTKLFQTNPTLASGDVKVSTDGAAFANLTTLPVVTPAGGKGVQVDLSASEMNGDNILVQFSDAAGSEWCDLAINLQTTARQIDDLAYPATSGRSIVVDAAGLVDANVVKVGPTGSGTAQTARDLGGNLDAAVSTRLASGSYTAPPSAASIAQAVWDYLTSAATTVGSLGKRVADFLTGDSYARLGAPAGASVSADIAAIQTKTTNLPASPAAVGSAMTLTSGERNAIADAYLDRADAIEVGLTPRQAQELFAAVLAGVLAGAGTTTITIRNAVANSKVRVTAVVDANGNRTGITYDLT